jgi:hypothetical protein
MALLFTLDDDGRLDWRGLGNTTRPDLTVEEAQLVALAEAAGALRYIGEALLSVAEAIREHKSD